MMLKRLPTTARRRATGEAGITGLETAIILIAFVVVASVFAYTVLSAGIFSSEKSKEIVHSALDEVRSTVVLRGGTVAYKGMVDTTGDKAGDTAAVVKIALTLGSAVNGLPIDVTPPYKLNATNGNLESSGLQNSLIISYLDDRQVLRDVAWTTSFTGSDDGDYSLESTEKATITIYLVAYEYDATAGLYYDLGAGTSDPFMDTSGNLLTAYQRFGLELIPVQGNALSIEKVAPQSLNDIMNLH